jgi:hypothetical protein
MLSATSAFKKQNEDSEKEWKIWEDWLITCSKDVDKNQWSTPPVSKNPRDCSKS